RRALSARREFIEPAAGALFGGGVQVELHLGVWKHDTRDVPAVKDHTAGASQLLLSPHHLAAHRAVPRDRRGETCDFAGPNRIRDIAIVEEDTLARRIEGNAR